MNWNRLLFGTVTLIWFMALSARAEVDRQALTDAIQTARTEIKQGQSTVSDAELDRQAAVLGNGRYFSQALEEAIARKKLPEALELLEAYSGDINALTTGQGPLIFQAAQWDDPTLVKALLDRKADPNRLGLNGETSLTMALGGTAKAKPPFRSPLRITPGRDILFFLNTVPTSMPVTTRETQHSI